MSVITVNQRELILFDLDGTLVDSVPDLSHSMNLALAELNKPVVTLEQVRQWVGQGAGKLCQHVINNQKQLSKQEELLQTTNTDEYQQLFNKFLEIYQDNVCVYSTVYDGVLDFLTYCKQQQKIMACVTNKPFAAAVALLKSLNLYQYFSLVVGGDTLTTRKPDPEPLLYAMNHFGKTTLQTLMIGDSKNDIEAAKSANIDCVVLGYGYNHGIPIEECNPQYLIQNLRQLIT